jgi:putative ABC transport system substrate-binding protein
MMWLAGAVLAVLALAPPPAAAQHAGKVARVGFLATAPLESRETVVLLEALRHGLRERGWTEGTNLVVESRSADGRIERFVDRAAELVRSNVDVIVAPNTPAARAARQATAAIPIVASAMGDPVGDGLAVSLARPGRNVTGLTFLGPELTHKRLALLKEALPRTGRVAALWHPGAFGERTTADMLRETEVAARNLGVQLRMVAVRTPDDLDAAFTRMVSERADAVIVFPSPMLYASRRRVMELAAKHRLPSMSNAREFAEVGGLVTYGANLMDLMRRATGYVDRILKGAAPAELPIEQPTTFELVVNLATARALGLTIPQPLLVRADDVIR